MDKRNYHIDVLRFLASLIVVFFHLNQSAPVVNNWYRSVVKYGWLGVPMFFVISGYCIISTVRPSTTAYNFFIKRIFRIFPPYWISIILVLLAAIVQKIFLGNNMVANIPRTFEAILATLTLTTAPVTRVVTINGVYWTLSYEFFFYIVMSLILCFDKKLMLPLLIAVSVAALFFTRASGPMFFLNQWPPFALGVSIFLLSSSQLKNVRIWSAIFTGINLYGLIHEFAFSAVSICALGTLALIFISQYVPSSSTVFSKMGQHSYSVYLIHVPIGVFMIGLLNMDWMRHTVLLNIIYDLVVYLLISAIALLMFSSIEKPSIEMGKAFSKK